LLKYAQFSFFGEIKNLLLSQQTTIHAPLIKKGIKKQNDDTKKEAEGNLFRAVE